MTTNYVPLGTNYRTIIELIQNGELGEDTTFNRPLIQIAENIAWLKNNLISSADFEPRIAVKNTGFNLSLATATDIINGTLTNKLAAANDSRMSDARTPKTHTHAFTDITATPSINGYILQYQSGIYVAVNPISVFPSLPTSFPISSINTLTERLAALDSGLFTTTANVNASGVRFSTLESLTTTLSSNITSLTGRVAGTETSISTVNLNLATLGIRVGTTESTLVTNNTKLITLSNRVTVTEGSITTHTTDIAANRATILTLSTLVSSIRQVPAGTIPGTSLYLDNSLTPVWRNTTRDDLNAIILDLEAKIALAAAPRAELRKEDNTPIPLLVGENYEEYFEMSGDAVYGKYVDIRGLAGAETVKVEFYSNEENGIWTQVRFNHDYTATSGAYTIRDWSYRDNAGTKYLRIRITNTSATNITCTCFIYAETF